ncbi:MAG: hypothetical protein KF799_02440 [Bdellovibrionales bacterium]|nr:hypothetical protein [Bdellovibrionales bacterium]
MKLVALLILCLNSLSSFAAVEFVGPGWGYGHGEKLQVDSIGVSTTETETVRVVFNFEDGRQMKLDGAHLALGLSLLDYSGKCLKFIPGYQFRSVSIITKCD